MVRPNRVADSGHEVLTRLFEVLAPGDSDLVAFLEAYFDESYSDDDAAPICVAGYVFEKEACRKLDLEWKAALDVHSLDYFHMVDCAHGNPPFKKLGRPACDELARRMIGMVRSHALFGVAFAVSRRDYDEVFPERKPFGDAYTYCCWTCLTAVGGWAQEHRFEGNISYFFEAGHKHARQANEIMTAIFNQPDLRRQLRYASHAFVPKITRPVQCADMLAWLHLKQVKNIIKPVPAFH